MKKLIFLLFLFLSPGVFAADPYAAAEFWRRDCYTKDDIIAYWNFVDTYSTGDLISNIGDMEQGFNADPCGQCPIGCTCVCAGTSNVSDNTSRIAKNYHSLKYSVDAGSSNIQVFCPLPNLDNNTAYELTFWTKGEVGLEDMLLRLQGQQAPYGATPLSYFAGTTDTWGAAIDNGFNNISSTWDRKTLYIINNTGSQLRSVQVSIRRNGASQTFYIDNIKLRKLRNIGPRSNNGLILTPAVTSDPVFGMSPSLLSFRGTYNEAGTKFDGVDDVIGYPDPGNIFDPSANTYNFSWAIDLKNNSNTANQIYLAKGTLGSRSYLSYYTGANNTCYLSRDGGGVNISTLTSTGLTGVNHSWLCTYLYNGDNTSSFWMYNNNSVIVGYNNARGPIFNSASGLGLADYIDLTGVNSSMDLKRVAFWRKYMLPIETTTWNNPWYPKYFTVNSCTNTSPSAICSWSECKDGTPTKCEPEGTGAKEIFSAKTELCRYNSFETQVGEDYNPTYTGWTKTETAGDGTASITSYRVDTFHGNIASRFKTTGTTSNVSLESSCMTTGVGGNIYAYLKYKKLKGDDNLVLTIQPYSAVDCSSGPLAATNLTDRIQAEWSEARGLYNTWPGGANSYTIKISSSANSDILVDEIDVKNQSYRTPWVHNNTAGTLAYTLEDLRLSNPLAEHNGTNYNYQNGFCSGQWVYTDFQYNDGVTHHFYTVPGTAGNNNSHGGYKHSTTVLVTYLYDSAGGSKTASLVPDSTNWNIGSWKYLEICSNNAGVYNTRHFESNNNTWYNWSTAGAGTGIQNGQTAVYSFYASPIGLFDGYYHGLWIGPYSATWPMYGFNKRPIKRPY